MNTVRTILFAQLLVFLLNYGHFAHLARGADWPMFGRDVSRNSVSVEKNPPLDWDIGTFDRRTGDWISDEARNVRWIARLGSMTHGTPVVADGRVFVGTNNGAGYLKRYPNTVDLGCLHCFRESDGAFLWQYSAEKLPTGRVHDWPMQGIGSTPLVEDDRMWFVSNRWEVVCLDTQGFHDKQNDGPYLDEPNENPNEADIIWRFDMMKELGVSPYGQGMGPSRRCSPAASYKNRIYVMTGKGIDESHINIPTPDAPSLICMDKDTGQVLWKDNSPGANVLAGSFASPLVAEIAGRAQVIVPQGDGWIRSFDALSGELLWKFDVNRKEATWKIGGRGERNYVLATPVLYRNRIYVATGMEVEDGEGDGQLLCLDPKKTGDISAELAVDRNGQIVPHRRIQAIDPEKGEQAIANANSGVIWKYTSTGDEFEDAMHRTISSVAVHNGLLIATDYAGLVHCFDAMTGKRYWFYDCLAAIWSSPLIVGDHVYVADEDGKMSIFKLSSDPDEAMNDKDEPLAKIELGNMVASSPIYANGTLYVATRSHLLAISNHEQHDSLQSSGLREALSGNWPQWRGPDRNNRSRETGLLQEWPETGPPLVWRADGLGEGIASLSIAGGRILTICQLDDAEYVRALDETTGEHLWTARLGTAVLQGGLMRWLTQRSPTIDADQVYAVSQLGELVCLQAQDGAELWRRSYAEDFKGERPIFGYADCPLVDGERIICTPGGPDLSVVALDRENGKVIWTCPAAGGRASHTAGVIAEVVGRRQVITFLQNSVVGVDLRDGNLLWRDDSTVDIYYHPNPPLLHGDQIVLINSGKSSFRVLRIKDADGGQRVEQVRSKSVARFDRFHESAFLVGDYVYELSNLAICVELKNGEIAWRKRLPSRSASATWADGRFYVHNTAGMMKLYEATPDGCMEKGSFKLADHRRTSGATAPVVAGGRLYVREDDRLFCYDIRQSSAQNRYEPRRVVIPALTRAIAERSNKLGVASEPRRTPQSVFSPTPHDVVQRMLELAQVKAGEVVVDLGSGDGRIVIAAAKKYGCRAIGYELDPELVRMSRQNARNANVENQVTFHQADLFTADLTEANVVTLFLLPPQNAQLVRQLKQLPAGARVVSHEFEIPGLTPDRSIEFESAESGETHRLQLFTTPLKESQRTDRTERR